MISASNTPLKSVPQLWMADTQALKELGIETVDDLVQAVDENGKKNLSDSSGIPPEPLDRYITAATAFLERQSTRQRAAVISVSMLIVIVAMSALLVISQMASDADLAYAKLQQKFSGAGQQGELLEDVDKLLDQFKEEPASSTVNLRLLKSVLLDNIALEELKNAAADPAAGINDKYDERYLPSFDAAREELKAIAPDDPRIIFAHVNSARAWTNQAEILGRIDSGELDEREFRKIARQIRNAQNQARSFTTLALNEPELSIDMVNQRVEDLVVELDNQITRRMLDQTQQQIGSLRNDLNKLYAYIMNDDDGLPGVLKGQKQLSDQTELLKSQGESIIDEVGDAKKLTRDGTAELNANLDNRLDGTDVALVSANSSLQKLDRILTQHADSGSGPVSANNCGLTDKKAAKTKLKQECVPAGGLRETLKFVATISSPKADGIPEVRIAEGPTDHPLRCDIENVMARFSFTDGDHTCRLVFSAD
jgi:hypothetical protein